MAKGSSQKLKLLYIADVFRKETNEQHPITIPQLIQKLETNYNISAERKALYDDIELLRDVYGMDIITRREGNNVYHFLGERDFQIAELQLLADAVACSKFLTEEKSNELIEKLGHLTSHYDEGMLKRRVIVANRSKSPNEKIYLNIDKIQQAIDENRQISFLYFSYDIYRNKVYKRDGARYVMSPYSLAWEDESYYCVGYYDVYRKISNFRVDRMESITITDSYYRPDDSFNISDYAKRVFGMFSGQTVKAKLWFDNSLTTVVMDKFGSDITLKKLDRENFYISCNVNVSPTFFAWLFTFGDKAGIISPDSLREQMLEHLNKAISANTQDKKNYGSK